MTCLAFLFASSFKAPDDCDAYVDPESPGYAAEHSWGRVDLYYTQICDLGYDVALLNLLVL
jgi:hypothetical protein